LDVAVVPVAAYTKLPTVTEPPVIDRRKSVPCVPATLYNREPGDESTAPDATLMVKSTALFTDDEAIDMRSKLLVCWYVAPDPVSASPTKDASVSWKPTPPAVMVVLVPPTKEMVLAVAEALIVTIFELAVIFAEELKVTRTELAWNTMDMKVGPEKVLDDAAEISTLDDVALADSNEQTDV
jgi:hypothetical protein